MLNENEWVKFFVQNLGKCECSMNPIWAEFKMAAIFKLSHQWVKFFLCRWEESCKWVSLRVLRWLNPRCPNSRWWNSRWLLSSRVWMSLSQIELVWIRVRVEWECFWVNLREDNKVPESMMAVSKSTWQNSRWVQSEWMGEVFLCKWWEPIFSSVSEFERKN